MEEKEQKKYVADFIDDDYGSEDELNKEITRIDRSFSNNEE
jgi:hypothetical protein